MPLKSHLSSLASMKKLKYCVYPSVCSYYGIGANNDQSSERGNGGQDLTPGPPFAALRDLP